MLFCFLVSGCFGRGGLFFLFFFGFPDEDVVLERFQDDLVAGFDERETRFFGQF